MKILNVKKIRPGAVLPARSTIGSAGYDLSACIDAPVVIPARGRASIPTGIAISIGDPGIVALVYGRSGLGIKHGIVPSNAVGVIDSDYRGELIVGLSNHSDVDYTVNSGDRIAQMLLTPVLTPEIAGCDELDGTERGESGFGSTGR